MLTRYATKKIIRAAVFTFAILILAGYATFAMHDFILGPSLTVIEPANGSTFSDPAVKSIKIKGVVKRIQDISLNGRSITIDDKGNFDETVLLAPGYNVFTFVVKDKFGRSREYRLEYTYKVN